MDDIVNGLQISPIADAERIVALPDRAAREAALLAIESGDRRDMVSHFLVLRYAKALCEAMPLGEHEDLIRQIPEHLVDDVKPLARSYIRAARIVAAGKA